MTAALLMTAFSGLAIPAVAQCDPAWSGLSGGADWEVRAFATFDEDGPGPLPPALFIGGGFGVIAGVESHFLTRWDGWTATPVGGQLEHDVSGLESLFAVEGPGDVIPAGLYAGGSIISAGGVPVKNLARWDGSAWHDVGGGVTSEPSTLAAFVWAMELFDEDGPGPEPPALFVGGQFERAGGIEAHGLARWDGHQWSEVGGGLAPWLPGARAKVKALATFDDGRGAALYAAGSFLTAAGEEVWNIARWDGRAWEAVGTGLSHAVEALAVFDEDGTGPNRPVLFAGGQFSSVVGGEPYSLNSLGRWDGVAWSAVGGWASGGSVLDMTVWDQDGAGSTKPSLYLGGFFRSLPDGTPCNQIAHWDGSTWHTLGSGVIASGFGPTVRALGVFDEDGSGPNPGGLYAGGFFYSAGGAVSENVARWGCPLPSAPPCAADCDADGELTFFDFLCFQNQFAFGDMRADCDGDRALTFFDFLCFQNAFAAGCP